MKIHGSCKRSVCFHLIAPENMIDFLSKPSLVVGFILYHIKKRN